MSGGDRGELRMDSITLENFRCFRERQTARLAPLTLLVGENSTGKTSFLALIRALCDLAYGFRNPDFKEKPYDLGSFDEIAHHRGARGSRADSFEAGFKINRRSSKEPSASFAFAFEKSGTTPVPVRRYITRGMTWIDESFRTSESYNLRVGTSKGSWEIRIPKELEIPDVIESDYIVPLFYLFLGQVLRNEHADKIEFMPLQGSLPADAKDVRRIRNLSRRHTRIHQERPFASAPVRSKPSRTYDPSSLTLDPEGDYVPMYLADLYARDEKTWTGLKRQLQGFGTDSGLFDEISIRRLGKKGGGEPFQVEIKKGGRGLKGPRRNLIDVGYGVSQILPVITELLRPDAPDTFLLQQPEVHLHPSAQAALGSLFCQVAGPERQLVVETHSDHLLDRVRMDVRDRKRSLKPDDVSILFFERGDLDVHIHSLRIDEEGNIVNAPDGYRSFFMEETARSLGL